MKNLLIFFSFLFFFGGEVYIWKKWTVAPLDTCMTSWLSLLIAGSGTHSWIASSTLGRILVFTSFLVAHANHRLTFSVSTRIHFYWKYRNSMQQEVCLTFYTPGGENKTPDPWILRSFTTRPHVSMLVMIVAIYWLTIANVYICNYEPVYILWLQLVNLSILTKDHQICTKKQTTK